MVQRRPPPPFRGGGDRGGGLSRGFQGQASYPPRQPKRTSRLPNFIRQRTSFPTGGASVFSQFQKLANQSGQTIHVAPAGCKTERILKTELVSGHDLLTDFPPTIKNGVPPSRHDREWLECLAITLPFLFSTTR